MRIFAMADRQTLELYAAACAGDAAARAIITSFVLPARLPPRARAAVRNARIKTIAERIFAESPGITAYALAELLHRAGAEIESKRTLAHPSFACLGASRDGIEATIRGMLINMEPHRRSGLKWPTCRTLFSIIH